MNINNLLIISLILFWIFLVIGIANVKKIGTAFNLADKRSFISGKESYNKLNKLIDCGEVSFFTFESYDESTIFTLVVTFQVSKDSEAKGTFKGENLDGVINDAFDWATSKGYLK